METGAVISITAYFVAMLAIGFYAWRKSTQNIKGYLLGGRDLGPAVAARLPVPPFATLMPP